MAHSLKPIRPAKIGGVVEDRLRGGGEVSVDRRDVVRLVGVRVEVVAEIGQSERMYSVSNPIRVSRGENLRLLQNGETVTISWCTRAESNKGQNKTNCCPSQ